MDGAAIGGDDRRRIRRSETAATVGVHGPLTGRRRSPSAVMCPHDLQRAQTPTHESTRFDRVRKDGYRSWLGPSEWEDWAEPIHLKGADGPETWLNFSTLPVMRAVERAADAAVTPERRGKRFLENVGKTKKWVEKIPIQDISRDEKSRDPRVQRGHGEGQRP